MTTERIAVLEDSIDQETLRIALGYAVALCEAATPPLRKVVLITHTNHQLDQGTSIAATLGKAIIKALLSGTPVTLKDDIKLTHATDRKLPLSLNDAVAVVYYAEDGLLERVDGIGALQAVVVVPDHVHSANKWVERWGPKIHGQAQAQPQADLITDPVVERALQELTRAVNLGHGIINPRDKEFADHTLRILRAKGHEEKAENVKSWAIQNGWKPGAARELGELAGKVFALKAKPRMTGIHDPEGKYSRWSTSD